MKDDRVGDGQVMTLDQCLSCSRYEPIIGQTYDLLNEVGANLANIEDDAQMGYMNLEKDMLEFMRVEKMHEMKKDGVLNYKTANTRDTNENDFKDQWDDGVKMVWKLTPVENQKPQINWRADINSEDKSPAKLDTYQSGPGQAGSDPGNTLSAGSAGDWMKKHVDAMQKILDTKPEEKTDEKTGEKTTVDPYPTARPAIEAGFKAAEDTYKGAIDAMKNNGYEQALQNACTKDSMDAVLMFSLSAMLTGGDVHNKGLFDMGTADGDPEKQTKGGIDKYNQLKGSSKTGDNPIGPVTAWKNLPDAASKLAKDDATYDEEWAKSVEGDSFFPSVAKAYMLIAAANTGLSQASSKPTNGDNNYEFPLKTADLTNAYLVQDFGAQSADAGVATVSDAIIIKVPVGTPVYSPVETGYKALTYEDDTLGNHTTIGDGTERSITFGGLDSLVSGASSGDVIGAGQQFGVTTGRLVIQVKNNNGILDPKTVWPILNGKASTEHSLGELIAQENSVRSRNE